jgi:signal transduction histidine kinase
MLIRFCFSVTLMLVSQSGVAQDFSYQPEDRFPKVLDALIHHPEDLRITNWNASNGLPEHYVIDIFEDSRGMVWLAHELFYTRWDGERFEVVLELDNHKFEGSTLYSFREIEDGSVWAWRTDIFGFEAKVFRLFPTPSETHQCRFERTASSFWNREKEITSAVRACAQQIEKEAGVIDETALYGTNNQDDPPFGWSIEKNDSGIWVSSDQLSARTFLPKAETIDLTAPFSDSTIWVSAEKHGYLLNRKGLVSHLDSIKKATVVSPELFITSNNGETISIVRRGEVFKIDLRELSDWSADAVNSVQLLKSGELLIATDAGLSVIDVPPAHLHSPTFLDKPFNARTISAVTIDSVWVGSWGNGGFLYSARSGTFVHQEQSPDYIWSSAVQTDGLPIWGMNKGIVVVDSDLISHKIDSPSKITRALKYTYSGILAGIGNNLILSEKHFGDPIVLHYATGNVWDIDFSANGSPVIATKFGIVSFDTTYTHYQQHFPETFFTSISRSSSSLWFTTRYKGLVHAGSSWNFSQISTEHGLPSRSIWATFEDSSNRLWLCTDAGIYWVDSFSIDAFLSGQSETVTPHRLGSRYGVDYGCARGEDPIAEVDDGMLLIAAFNGLIQVNTKGVEPWTPNSKPAVYNIQANESSMGGDATVFSSVGSWLNNIEIFFYYFDLWNQEDLEYHYLLEGVHEEWRKVSSVGQIRYFDISPGSYQFRIKAVNRISGAESPETRVTVRLSKRFFHTAWFQVGVLLVFLAGLWSINRYFETERAKKKLQTQRYKILSDMHDGLGPSLASITLTLQQIRIPETAGSKAKELLKEAIQLSRQQNLRFRDAIWLANSNSMPAKAISARMRRFLNGLHTDFPISFTENVSACQYQFDIDEVKNIYLLFQEAVQNALTHSNCSELRVVVTCYDNSFNLRVSDNGRGFDLTSCAMGLGIDSMKSRARQLASDLVIETQVDRGTIIELKANLKNNEIGG